MNRWGARIFGLILLIVFVLLMMNLQRQLLMIQRNRQTPVTSTR